MELHHPIMSKLWDLGGRTKRRKNMGAGKGRKRGGQPDKGRHSQAHVRKSLGRPAWGVISDKRWRLLRPKNYRGSYSFILLEIGRRIFTMQGTVLQISESVIGRVDQIAAD